MQTTSDFLDAVKAKRGLASDYALAKLLGITTSGVSAYRTKRTFLGDSQAIHVAELLEMDPAIILAAVHAERAKTEPEKAVWRHVFEKLGGLAACALLGIALLTLPAQPAQAAAGGAALCILCKMRRRHAKRLDHPTFPALLKFSPVLP